jgi:hypothetical protein
MNTHLRVQKFYPLRNVTAKLSSAIAKAGKRLILAIRQSMWDLWWAKWHWTAFFTTVSVLHRQLLFHFFKIIYHVKDAQWPYSMLHFQKIQQPYRKKE